MRHIEATVVDQTHLRVHPPLALPVGAVVRLAIVTESTKPAAHSRRKHGIMKLKWAGGLKEYRSRFTSLGLQKQSLDWWSD